MTMADDGAREVWGDSQTSKQQSEQEVNEAFQKRISDEVAKIMEDVKCYKFMSDYRECISQ